MAPTGGSTLFSRPPLLRIRHPFLLFTIIKHLAGVILTLLVLSLLLLISPIILTFRLIGYTKRSKPDWQYNLRNCSHNWPLIGQSPDLGIVSFSSDVDKEKLNFNITDVSLGGDESSEEEMFGLKSGNVVKEWKQNEKRFQGPRDLSSVLNEPGLFPKDKVEMRVVNGFLEGNIERSLLIVSNPSASCICLPRLLSVISNQRLYLEMEPLPAYHFFVPIRHTYCLHNFIVVAFRLATSGASALLRMLIRRESLLWTLLSGESKKPKHRRIPRARDSSVDNRPEKIVVHDGSLKENGSLKASSLLNTETQTSHVRCWRIVPSTELVGRAERLLRATSAEMMLALVAGTLRTYCREQGIKQPSDVGCLVPVSCRNFLPIACGYSCDVLSFPLQLPVGVEGTVPRVWAVQKRLLDGLNGHIPAALKMAQVSSRLCATKGTSTKWMKPFFGSNSIHVAFYRASGDFKVSRTSTVESIRLFPSLNSTILASFVFIQCGKTTQLCASLCRKTFPDPNVLLNIFERETYQLLDHLAVRILSLPQTTFLPGVHHFAEETEEEEPPSSSEYLREKTTPKKQEKECSLDELHELLATVQQELDGMRANPQGDRGENIRKLAELEAQMQMFHDSITERLGIGTEPEEDLVENVLAPYKDPPMSSRERRYSRDVTHSHDKHRKASHSSI